MSVRYQRAPQGSLGSRAFEEGEHWRGDDRGFYGGAEVEGGGDDGDVTEKPRTGRCGAAASSNKLGSLSRLAAETSMINLFQRGSGRAQDFLQIRDSANWHRQK